MRSVKKSLFIIILFLFVLFVLFSIGEGWSTLLLFPILVISYFLAMYVIHQNQKDAEENIQKGFRYEVEDREAEKWIKHDLVPRTLKYMKAHQWMLIVYAFVFIVAVSFVWSYISGGLQTAIKNMGYIFLLFWFFVFYILVAPDLYDRMYIKFPKRLKRIIKRDWLRGYLFLLPVSYLLYVLSPFGNTSEEVFHRLAAVPQFLLFYTIAFLCLYSIVYLRQDVQQQEEKELKKSIKEYIREQKEK